MAKKQSKPAKKGAGSKRPTASKAAKKTQIKKTPAKAVRGKTAHSVKKSPVAKAATRKAAPIKRAEKKAPASTKAPASKRAQFENTSHPVKKLPPKAAAAPAAQPVETAVETVPALPTRAPTRKIFGANNTVIVVAQKGAPAADAANPSPEPENKPAEPEMPVFVPKLAAAAAPQTKFAWNDLPPSVPANVKFLVNSAIKESENASSSPFPFAKFISSLPQDLCGLEFAVLVLNLEHAPDEIGRLCGYSTERIMGLISTGETAITDKFATLCPDMYRKWRAQFAGRSVSVEALIEHHLVSKVDRSFQALLAGVVLSAMGIKSPAFAVPLAAVNLGRVH